MKFEPGQRVAHYVKPNETVRVPRRHIFLHIEGRTRTTKDGHIGTWGTGIATYRAGRKGRPTTGETVTYQSQDVLWRDVTAHCRKGERTVVWAHNLGLAVRLGDALHHLPRLGWRLVAHNLAPHGTWLSWTDGNKTLVMADVAAIFPKTLAQIGKLFGLSEPNVPVDRETDAYRLARVQASEQIIRQAVTVYLQWIEHAGLGNWQYTGAGQSYAAFRHLHMKHKLLVHDDEMALIAERRAMWTGRCEAYWHGTMLRTNIHEWDFTSSYASICASTNLPHRLIGPMPNSYNWRRVLDDPNVAMLAEVSVSTVREVAPTEYKGRIVWPIGEYETTLWDVEIKELIRAGAEVRVIRGWLYRCAPVLADWAQWILTSLGEREDIVPAWQRVIMKHWSTALIGRFGMAYTSWDTFGRAPKSGVDRRGIIDIDTGERYDLMQIGHDVYKQSGVTEWQHSMPAITGYVMACARVQLWRLIEALPAEALLYVDTDSLLVTDQWQPLMAELATTPIGKGLRLKNSWDGFSIYGPRQIITGPRVRVAGVPTAARRISRHTFTGEIWESLPVALGTGGADKVVRRSRTWTAKATDRRRNGPPVGWTHPIRIGDAA